MQGFFRVFSIILLYPHNIIRESLIDLNWVYRENESTERIFRKQYTKRPCANSFKKEGLQQIIIVFFFTHTYVFSKMCIKYQLFANISKNILYHILINIKDLFTLEGRLM